MRSSLAVADLQHTQGQLSRRPRNATPLLPAFAHTRFARLIRLSQTPRSDRSCRRYVHQCIDTVSAWTECHDKEHAAHHREVALEQMADQVQPALEFGKGARHLKHELAGGCGGVDRLLIQV